MHSFTIIESIWNILLSVSQRKNSMSRQLPFTIFSVQCSYFGSYADVLHASIQQFGFICKQTEKFKWITLCPPGDIFLFHFYSSFQSTVHHAHIWIFVKYINILLSKWNSRRSLHGYHTHKTKNFSIDLFAAGTCIIFRLDLALSQAVFSYWFSISQRLRFNGFKCENSSCEAKIDDERKGYSISF